MTRIAINDLKVKYPGRDQPTLRNIKLIFEEGQTVLLLGSSGSGKSTLGLTLNGLIPQSLGAEMSGEVLVDGLNTATTPTSTLAQKVGVVFQDPEAQFVTLKVEDEILFGLENLRQLPESMPGKINKALTQVKMIRYRQSRVDQLSGGQKQRIALACLLAMEPQFLIFDEPTANLDPVGTEDVFALLSEIKAQSKHTLLLIEHKLDALIHLIDRVVVLGQDGGVLTDGSPSIVFYEEANLLQEHGIWIPQMCLLGQALRRRGLLPNARPLTVEEMAEVLEQLLQESGSTAIDHAELDSISRIADSEKFNDSSNSVGPIGDEPGAEVNPPSILRVRNLSFSYGPKAVLKNIYLDIPVGDFLAIVGANGAGKTTLAQHMMGILPASAGHTEVQGRDMTQIPASDLAKQVGYVFQNPEHQFITNSVIDEVAYGLRVAGETEANIIQKSEAMLERFGLIRYATASPFTLSHGEKRRLSVAIMLAMGQQMLILDEPTFGQDQRNADAIMTLLQTLNQEGRTIVMITHDMQLVATYAKRVAVMIEGEIPFTGTPAELFEEPDLLSNANLALPPIAQLVEWLKQNGRERFPDSQHTTLTIDDFLNQFISEL
ncbi:MAG: ABC transporter ATP-binding protein [Chloroflexota bacterium]